MEKEYVLDEKEYIIKPVDITLSKLVDALTVMTSELNIPKSEQLQLFEQFYITVSIRFAPVKELKSGFTVIL